MNKLTAYRVCGNIIEDMHYSKIFYIDESQYSNQDERNEAIDEMALEAWCNGEDWSQEEGDIYEGFNIYEIKRY